MFISSTYTQTSQGQMGNSDRSNRPLNGIIAPVEITGERDLQPGDMKRIKTEDGRISFDHDTTGPGGPTGLRVERDSSGLHVNRYVDTVSTTGREFLQVDAKQTPSGAVSGSVLFSDDHGDHHLDTIDSNGRVIRSEHLVHNKIIPVSPASRQQASADRALLRSTLKFGADELKAATDKLKSKSSKKPLSSPMKPQ